MCVYIHMCIVTGINACMNECMYVYCHIHTCLSVYILVFVCAHFYSLFFILSSYIRKRLNFNPTLSLLVCLIPIHARANILYTHTRARTNIHVHTQNTIVPFTPTQCNVFPNSLSCFQPAACASQVLPSDIQITGWQANALSCLSVSSRRGRWEEGGDSKETKQSAAINGDIFHVTLKVNTLS